MSSTLDDHIRAALDRIRVGLSGQLEADLSTSTSDILRAVAEEHRLALVAANEQTTATMRSEAEQQIAGVREEFAREREEFARHTERLARHTEDLQRSSTSEIAGLERVLGEVRDDLDVARRGLDDLRSAREALERQLEEGNQGLERSRQAEAATRRELQESIEHAQSQGERIEELQAKLGQTARLASAFRTLDQATSLGDILEHLAQSACQEAGRTAVFLVNGGKLRGWRALGFPAGQPIAGSDFDSAESGVVGQAVRSGAGQQHRNGDDTQLPPFAQTDGPRDAVALPVQVGGSVIAVLYADAARADRPEDPEWLDTIDAMTTHAGRVLEAMTVRQAAALWTPRRGVVRSSHG